MYYESLHFLYLPTHSISLQRQKVASSLGRCNEEFYSNADVITKQKLLCSIFSSKLIFENKNYRTPKLNKGFNFIYQNIRELERIKTKNGRESFDNLPLCTQGGT